MLVQLKMHGIKITVSHYYMHVMCLSSIVAMNTGACSGIRKGGGQNLKVFFLGGGGVSIFQGVGGAQLRK